ncbi:MAG: hypothetical protein IIX49_01025, partial [Oscillospiraceae bacterium]|nr:hypothetical protein [Oscillospiraceae bacterium]
PLSRLRRKLSDCRFLSATINPTRKKLPTRPGGVHRGGRLGVGAGVLIKGSSIDRLRINASPQPASFGSFLADQEKNNTAPDCFKKVSFFMNELYKENIL